MDLQYELVETKSCLSLASSGTYLVHTPWLCVSFCCTLQRVVELHCLFPPFYTRCDTYHEMLQSSWDDNISLP